MRQRLEIAQDIQSALSRQATLKREQLVNQMTRSGRNQKEIELEMIEVKGQLASLHAEAEYWRLKIFVDVTKGFLSKDDYYKCWDITEEMFKQLKPNDY